jgi:hypothetical protein
MKVLRWVAPLLCALAGANAGLAALPAAPPPPPARLSETGLYRADGSIDPRNRPVAPQYPLWTDGARKSRWIRLPAGATIDAADVDAWSFPPGTVIWKEFAWGGRRVETRLMRRERDGGWTYATYAWSEDQADALLAPREGIPGAHEVAPGRRHSIPGVDDCTACHGSAPSPVLGFTALQLSDDRDPLAPHAEPLPAGAVTLRTLVAEGRLVPARAELAARPPRIRAQGPVERAAVGYLSANCGSCHNARGPLARLGFSLLHSEADGTEPALATAVGAGTRFPVPGAPADSARVIEPGAPERSALLHRLRSRRPASQMPPLGTVVADTTAAALVRRWIEGLVPPRATAVVPGSAADRRRGS